MTEPGLGKPTQLVPIGEFDFSSSEDPLVLPGQTGSTKVTVTRIKEPKQKASSTTPPDLEEEELAPHLIKTSLPPEEVAVAGDDIREAPEEKKEQVVAVRSRRPWRLVEIVVGSILATVLGYLVVYLLWFRSPPDPPDDPGRTVDLVQTRIRDKEFEAALRELNEATLDEKTKNQERAKVVKAWLDDLGPKGPRTQVEGLRNLLNYVKDHEEANQRYRAALALYLPARAEELSEAGDSPGALDLLKTFDPQGQPKAVQEKIALTEKRVLSAWVGRARTHRTDKDFNKANKVLSAILQKRPGNVEAIAVQKDVANDIAEVSRERDVLIAAGQFPMALKYVADAWPNGGKELSTPIFDGWLAWAKARKDSDPAAAEAALDQLLSRDAGNSAAESLRTQVRKQLVTSAILTLIAENKTASCRDAARKLYGPDGKKLGDAERDRLGEQIAKAWLDLVNKEKIPRLRKDLLIALTNEIPDSIPSSKTAKKLVGEIPDIEGDKVVRDAVQDLLKERFAASRTALQRARREVGTSDKDLVARVDALLPVVDLAERATADPLKGDLEGLEKALSDSRITDGDRSNLKGLAGRLFDRRIRLRVQALPKDVNWSQLLADCKKVEEAPSAWVLACRVECLVELGKANGKEWAKARSELEKFKAEPEAVAYAAYVLALADWQANDYPSAANRLLQLFEDDKPVPAVLQDVPARRTKAVQFFLSAAGVLRGRGQLTQPFGTARDASEAFGWLKQARRLAGGTASVPLRANLALAAWYKMPRNSDLAKDLSDTLKDKATLKEALLDADVYRVLLIHAATRDNTAAGRKDALEGYLAALDCVREFLKTRAEPQVAEHFYGEVVKWARADDGKALLGEGPDDEVKGRYARLCGGIARLFKDFAPSWYKLTKPAGGPIQQAKDLYHLAYRNATTDADRAEFLAFKGFMSNELPSPKVGQLKEFAVEAQKLAPPYAGGFGLEGSALILEERGKTDLADRRRLLTEADGKLDKALELVKALKPEDRQRELKALLLRTKGVLHVELANYHSVADRKKREGSLQAAQQAIEQALALDDRSLEARDTLGCILEDYGWLLGKTDQFDEACKEFKKAMEPGSLETGRTSPWLGRGRTRFKWAEALMVSQGPDDKTVKGLLDESFSDLGEVVDHPRNPIQVAEALYWQGRIHTLRNKTQDAQEAFKRSVELARQENSEGWQEAAAQGWADVAAREVLARYQEPGYNLASNLQEALKRCDELEKFSKPRAASFRVGLIRLAIYRTKEKPEALLKVFEDGLEPGGRTQDEFFRVHLLVQRSDVYLKGREVKRDLAKAHADATAALKLSETAVVDAGTRAYALGVIGLARQAQAPSADEKTKEEYREEALESLRKALDLSPKHFAAWEWKAYVSGLLILKLPKKVKDDGPTRTEVTLAEEACRYYLEAEQDLPEVERKGGGYDWLADNSQPNLKEKAVPILRKALEKFAFDADVWKWHRGIAAVLAEEKDDLKLEARASLRKAVEGARNPDDLKRLQKLQGKIN